MSGYKPLYIKGMSVGLVQDRENFILPDDAYPVLENAFVWRERIKRKQGYEILGRLRRTLSAISLGISGASPWTFNIYSTMVPAVTGEPDAQIEPGSVVINIPFVDAFFDQGDGTLLASFNPAQNSGVINYSTGVVTITYVGVPAVSAINVNYFPCIPVMGLRSRELNNTNNEQLVAFDQKYAYIYIGSPPSGGWEEFIPGTTWTGNDSDFFWSTNYWVSAANAKLFWVTNFSGIAGDPIRYTDGTIWTNFAPTINAAGDVLAQCLAMLPFRSRLMAFNTLEGPNLAGSTAFFQRIRWSAIGSPLSVDSWLDDTPGKGGYLDIPTSESIISVGFVRDNLVIYCERSTWQLRYTGRSIAPFQIEKVNSELGAESTFSAVQFDTSLVGIGDKGVVECDSFKSNRIDVKIPDLVFQFNNDANGTKRIHGIRDFGQRLAYWTYPYKPKETQQVDPDFFPNRRLVYNYENDSWAIFTDSLTTLGTFQDISGRRWQDYIRPSIDSWENQNYPWINRPSLFPSIVGGNQQGYVEFLDQQVTNDVSLFIQNITGFGLVQPIRITSPNHNLVTDQVIQILGIPAGTPFATDLNGNIYGIERVDADNFDLWIYTPSSGDFDTPANSDAATYIGGGEISIRDNFSIVSKKFNLLDDGQNIQLGYIDILMDNTEEGAITLNVYNDYNDSQPVNRQPLNVSNDTFFNSIVPTSVTIERGSSKNWQRVFCPSRAAFLTIEWTLSNAQLVGPEQESNVQIDTQILWIRPAGRQLPIGI